MSIETVTVSWDIDDVAGTGTEGSITFRLSSTLVDANTGDVISPDPPYKYQVLGTPGQSDPLVANDSPGLEPLGSYYTITVGGSDSAASYVCYINHAAGATQTLGSLIAQNNEPALAYGQYLPLPSGTAVAGDVPIATGQGSATEWGTQASGSGFPSSPVVSGTPTAGQVLTAQSATQATWETPAGGSGSVTSFNGRTGAVVPAAGDYTADETGALALPSGTPAQGQVPMATGTGTATTWQTPVGEVTSVNGYAGAVELTYTDVGADEAGAAAAVQAASMPLPTGAATAGLVPIATGSGNASAWTALPAASGSNIDGGSAATGMFPVGTVDGGAA